MYALGFVSHTPEIALDKKLTAIALKNIPVVEI
jgi:hypothetical protein